MSRSSRCLCGFPAKCLRFQSGVGDGWVCSGVQTQGEGRGFNTEKIVFRERRLPAGALEDSNPACSLAMSENHRLTGASSEQAAPGKRNKRAGVGPITLEMLGSPRCLWDPLVTWILAASYLPFLIPSANIFGYLQTLWGLLTGVSKEEGL